MIIALISVTIIMFKRRDELETNEGLRKRIGAFYEDIKLDSTWALMYTPIFIARRILFCSLLLCLGSY